MSAGLHFLMCAGWSKDPIVPEAFGPLPPEQCSLLSNIWFRLSDVAAGPNPDVPFMEEINFLTNCRVSYDGVV